MRLIKNYSVSKSEMEVGSQQLKTQNGKRVKMVILSFLLMVVDIGETGKLIKMGKYRSCLLPIVEKKACFPELKVSITDGHGFNYLSIILKLR